jgi:hypothetical protein
MRPLRAEPPNLLQLGTHAQQRCQLPEAHIPQASCLSAVPGDIKEPIERLYDSDPDPRSPFDRRKPPAIDWLAKREFKEKVLGDPPKVSGRSFSTGRKVPYVAKAQGYSAFLAPWRGEFVCRRSLTSRIFPFSIARRPF